MHSNFITIIIIIMHLVTVTFSFVNGARSDSLDNIHT